MYKYSITPSTRTPPGARVLRTNGSIFVPVIYLEDKAVQSKRNPTGVYTIKQYVMHKGFAGWRALRDWLAWLWLAYMTLSVMNKI
jgi:hypothetical protein